MARRLFMPLFTLGVLAAAGTAGFLTRERWLPLLRPASLAEEEAPGEAEAPTGKVIVNEQAQRNLGLTARPVKPGSFWKTIQVPGVVADRPGVSDRGVVAPATGVIAGIHRLPGDAVRPGDKLFTLKLLSESLHQTQTELFKAAQDIALARAQRKRLADSGGAVPEARVIEVESQITRLEVASKAYRQDLLTRGFGPDLIAGVAEGRFVNEVPVVVPPRADAAGPPAFEVQALKVDLGQQVQAGQALCTLAGHQALSVEGRAFPDETALLERSVREGWPVEVDFREHPSAGWGELGQTFRIRHIANTIDPADQTFEFRTPLENESRYVTDEDGRTQLLWRFRPGQRVRIRVRVEELKDVLVVPADAVVREGADAFVFTQNVNTFVRRPVRVVYHDGRSAVLADDGSLPAGVFVVQAAAAQLNRLVKAGGSGAVPKGYHIHADGSLHKNEDEGK